MKRIAMAVAIVLLVAIGVVEASVSAQQLAIRQTWATSPRTTAARCGPASSPESWLVSSAARYAR